MVEFTTDSGVHVEILELEEYGSALRSAGSKAPTSGAAMPRAFIHHDQDGAFDDGDELVVYAGAVDDPDFPKLIGHEATHPLGHDHPDYYDDGIWKVVVHAVRRCFDLTAATGLLRWRKSPREAWRVAQVVVELAREVQNGR